MTRTNKYPESSTFHYFNKNTLGRINGDCVIRAIATFLDISWEQCVREMTECGLKTCLVVNDKKNIENYLKEKGFTKMKQPKRKDGTKYTCKEFCKELADWDKRYVLIVAHHATSVVNSKIWDIWDCGYKSVGNYWVR